MQAKEHWEKVYTTKTETEVSWFQEHARMSLQLIQNAKIPKSAAIIDVGGGASTLVDDLLADGYENITVLDLSKAALNTAAARLGDQSKQVHWLEANVLEVNIPPSSIDVWHDRAVFHFLVTEEERTKYVQNVFDAVKPGGLVIIATFAEDGPTKCSGLPVMRYNVNGLHAEFGDAFTLLGHEQETHLTPAGNEQKFIYCFCRKMVS